MGRTPCFHCYRPGFNAGLPTSQAVWLKKKTKKNKKNKKELLAILLFFSSRKIELMRDLAYKTSEYLQGIVAEVCSFPVKVHYS